jgi:hypothetical protein
MAKGKQGIYKPQKPQRRVNFPDDYVIACTNCPCWVSSKEQKYVNGKITDGEVRTACPVCDSDMLHYRIKVEVYIQKGNNFHSRFPFGPGWTNNAQAYIKRSLS